MRCRCGSSVTLVPKINRSLFAMRGINCRSPGSAAIDRWQADGHGWFGHRWRAGTALQGVGRKRKRGELRRELRRLAAEFAGLIIAAQSAGLGVGRRLGAVVAPALAWMGMAVAPTGARWRPLAGVGRS